MSEPVIPTTDEMRGIFIGYQIQTCIDADAVEASMAFDAWLAARDAEIREQAAQRIYEALTLGGHGDDVDAGLHLAAEIVRGA